METTNTFDWTAIIVAGIAGATIISVVALGVLARLVSTRTKGPQQLSEAIRQQAEANRAISEQLTQIGGRLTAIETTLNDIP